MNKDIVSKEVVKSVLLELARSLFGLDIKDITLINEEFERVESRRADIVAVADNDKILHIEIQTNYDKLMPLRMLRYYTDIKTKYFDFPVLQYVVYLGKGNLKNFIVDEKLDYSYNLIDMKKVDCNVFLGKNTPEDIVLAILCDFKDKNPENVVEYIIEKLISITDSNGFKKYMLILEEFSELRDLQKIVKEKEMFITNKVKFEDLPSYEIGMEKGIEKGMEKGMEKGIIALYKITKDINLIEKEMGVGKDKILIILEKNGIRVKH
ncbi:hypothetical protein [Nautilia sp.]